MNKLRSSGTVIGNTDQQVIFRVNGVISSSVQASAAPKLLGEQLVFLAIFERVRRFLEKSNA